MGLIPAEFAESTIAREGDAGRAWLAALPAIADEVLTRWKCTQDGPTMYGGVGIVLPVQGDRVVKISYPHPGNDYEADAFETWAGRGAVKLYRRDDERYALLLERAHPEALSGVDDGDIMALAAGQLSRRLAVAAPEHLPRLSDRADEWTEELRSGAANFPDALPPSAVDAALTVIDDLGRKQPELVVHGDFHARNILRSDREPWLAVDPKGYVGDPAYDAATFALPRAFALIDSPDLFRTLLRELAIFAEAAELDPLRIRRWALFRAVQGGYHGRRNGFRRGRRGSLLERVVALADDLAVALA
jgi:streptomycin 6-kinase